MDVHRFRESADKLPDVDYLSANHKMTPVKFSPTTVQTPPPRGETQRWDDSEIRQNGTSLLGSADKILSVPDPSPMIETSMKS